MNDKTNLDPALIDKLEETMTRVRQMKPGGDLEGLLEEQSAQLKTLLYEKAITERKLAAAQDPAAFPPSGLPGLQPGHAPKFS